MKFVNKKAILLLISSFCLLVTACDGGSSSNNNNGGGNGGDDIRISLTVNNSEITGFVEKNGERKEVSESCAGRADGETITITFPDETTARSYVCNNEIPR